MARNYYITQPGRLRRKDNTLYLEPEDAPRIPIPVEDIDALYFYGELDLNTKLLNFLAQKHIAFHVFNYYGYYSGSYYPREYLNSGALLVKQVQHYEKPAKRMRSHINSLSPGSSICCEFCAIIPTAVRIATHKSQQLRLSSPRPISPKTQMNLWVTKAVSETSITPFSIQF